jgi:hypothetical protein
MKMDIWISGSIFSFLWLYSPIWGLGRLRNIFRFISVTRSRTVSRAPWTGDQLVARATLTVPGDCDDDGEVGGMNDFGRGNRSTRRKRCPDATLSTTNTTFQTWARTRAAAVENQRLTATAEVQPEEVL